MKTAKTIAFTSGKGGVGKSSLLANVGYSLARSGYKVGILDGDLGMANMDIMFGKRANHSIYDVIMGDKTLSEIMVELVPNLMLIPGGSGISELAQFTNLQRRGLIDAVSEIGSDVDYFLVDTSPGFSENVLYLNSAVQVPIVVITPDPSSLTDAYALIKVLNQKHKDTKFSVICNMVRDDFDGIGLFQRFSDVTQKFLHVGLGYLGSVPFDPLYKRSTLGQRLVTRHEPGSDVSRSIELVVQSILKSQDFNKQKAGLQLFWERVVSWS
jgi:flagellar biosynthesis protein FlhG